MSDTISNPYFDSPVIEMTEHELKQYKIPASKGEVKLLSDKVDRLSSLITKMHEELLVVRRRAFNLPEQGFIAL